MLTVHLEKKIFDQFFNFIILKQFELMKKKKNSLVFKNKKRDKNEFFMSMGVLNLKRKL
jgi:hypothetical protein